MSSATKPARIASASAPARDGRPRKSPLRTATMQRGTSVLLGREEPPETPDRRSRGIVSASDLRLMAISEFTEWLRSRTNKHDRPFQEDTITAYRDAARALHRWMSEHEVEEDFTACDTGLLNRFFAGYLASHCQTGTNTVQRNLSHLFTWLQEVYVHPHPYTAGLHRYAPQKTRPSTLDEQFIKDMLEVTGGGKPRDFADARDHAIIRSLLEGVRRTEAAQQHLEDLSADLIARPFVRVVPLKGARSSGEGRIVPLSPSAARAYAVYLRVRRSHRHADSPALWLGTRNRGPLTGSGLAQMLKRRADEAGYDPDVHPHQFRHTFAHDWLDSGRSEGDLMRLMGWTDRSMLDLYAEDLQVQRAISAKQRAGDLY
jgi:site-specific recombinase XerD